MPEVQLTVIGSIAGIFGGVFAQGMPQRGVGQYRGNFPRNSGLGLSGCASRAWANDAHVDWRPHHQLRCVSLSHSSQSGSAVSPPACVVHINLVSFSFRRVLCCLLLSGIGQGFSLLLCISILGEYTNSFRAIAASYATGMLSAQSIGLVLGTFVFMVVCAWPIRVQCVNVRTE